MQIDRTVRVVRTWRFIAAPDAEVGLSTLRVTPTQTSASDETIPQHGHSNIGDTDSPITTPTTAETRSVRPAPTRERIYAPAGRPDAVVKLSDDPNNDEPRRSWYISRPWTIPSEFRPLNAT